MQYETREFVRKITEGIGNENFTSPGGIRVSAVLAVSLALGLTMGCHRDPNKQKQRYLESGKRYAEQGKLKEATIQFANALKVDHNFAEAHYQLSKVFLKQGSVMPAYGELMRTVDLQPGNIQARIDLGNMLVAGQTARPAAEQANAVLAINPNNADAYALLSSVAASRETAPRLSPRSRRLSPSTPTAPTSMPHSAFFRAPIPPPRPPAKSSSARPSRSTPKT